MFHIFTHDDLDGVGPVILCNAAKMDLSTVIYNNYESIDHNLNAFLESNEYAANDTLLITDITPSEEMCEKLDTYHRNKIKVILLDHHKTKSWVSNYSWATYESTSCGTRLVLQYLQPNIPDKDLYFELVEAINAWDLWKLQSNFRTRGENLNTLLRFIGTHDFVETFSTNPTADNEKPYSLIIQYLNKNKEEYVKKVIEDQLLQAAYHMDDLGNTYKILFATDYISEVGHAALVHPDCEDLKYIVIVNPTIGMCSFRSKDVDISNIAKKLGGGGHPSAAGCRIDSKSKIERYVVSLLDRLDN